MRKIIALLFVALFSSAAMAAESSDVCNGVDNIQTATAKLKDRGEHIIFVGKWTHQERLMGAIVVTHSKTGAWSSFLFDVNGCVRGAVVGTEGTPVVPEYEPTSAIES